MKTATKWIVNILLIIFIITLVVSGYYLISTYLERKQSIDGFNELTRVKNQLMASIPENTEDPHAELRAKLNAYGELHKQNSDFVGWIAVDGTNIDYPVMQTPHDPEYYLRRDFNGESSESGTPFVDADCDIVNDDNITIYGHNMNNGTMFAALLNYKDEDFYKEHKLIRFDTLTESAVYEVLGVFMASVTPDNPNGFYYYGFTKAADQSEYDSFIEKVKYRSLYDTGVNASLGDRLITLSTCEYSNIDGRLAVVAKKISSETLED